MPATNSSSASSTLRRVRGRPGVEPPGPPPKGDGAGMAVAVTTGFLFASARQQLAAGVGVGLEEVLTTIGDAGGEAGSRELVDPLEPALTPADPGAGDDDESDGWVPGQS